MNESSTSYGFPEVTRDDWLKRVEEVLKGAPFAESLVSKTADSITIDPLYGEAAGPRVWRAAAVPWTVTQRIDLPDPAAANVQALDNLEHGATGLSLIFQGAASGHGFGLNDHDERTIARALADVRLDCIALRLEAGPHGQRAAEAVAAYIGSQPVDPERLTLEFGMDPLGVLAARGDLDAAWSDTAERVHATINNLRARNFTGPFMMADGRVWHEGGATAAQELGLVLAAATAYLRALEALPDDALARSVAVTLAADQDTFLTLAKFRAMRLLWARVLHVAQLPAIPLRLHGEASWRMMAAKDPHTNILRAAAGVFGAALGGADSIAVLPFSLAQGLPDAFARRVARNSQNILSMESNLWRVSDPAGGAGYIEHLTTELCKRAWDEFQAVEKTGGLVEALRTGTVQKTLAEERRRAAALIADGEQPILGVTDFKPHAESSTAIESATPIAPRPRIGAAILVEPIPSLRLSEAFEAETEVRAIA